MAHPNNIESRVSALETKVHDLTERVGGEQDAAAARVLAGGADRESGAVLSSADGAEFVERIGDGFGHVQAAVSGIVEDD